MKGLIKLTGVAVENTAKKTVNSASISNYTKDNNEDGSYVYYQSDVGTRYGMGSYISLPSLVKGD